MKYIIIGLGNYGGGLAEELMAIGHEVIGVDQNEGRVESERQDCHGFCVGCNG